MNLLNLSLIIAITLTTGVVSTFAWVFWTRWKENQIPVKREPWDKNTVVFTEGITPADPCHTEIEILHLEAERPHYEHHIKIVPPGVIIESEFKEVHNPLPWQTYHGDPGDEHQNKHPQP